MALYMIQFAYTPGAKAALARVPEDRSVVFGQLVEDMGGRLHAFYNSLGDYDGVAIFEAPGERAAHKHRARRQPARPPQRVHDLGVAAGQGKRRSDARGEQAEVPSAKRLARQGT
jgi:GYD domain